MYTIEIESSDVFRVVVHASRRLGSFASKIYKLVTLFDYRVSLHIIAKHSEVMPTLIFWSGGPHVYHALAVQSAIFYWRAVKGLTWNEHRVERSAQRVGCYSLVYGTGNLV